MRQIVEEHVWGMRYIDELVLTRQDVNNNWVSVASGDYTHYALTDHQFSVIALIDNIGKLVERIAYTAYGEARHRPAMDINGDGAVNAIDAVLSTAAHGKLIYQSGYNPDADIDRDGEIDATGDDIIMIKDWVAAVPTGRISRTHMAAGADNTIGYCGYAFNAEVDCVGLYTVRFRHYDPQFGRWLSRDPAGYMDSMSLYGYGYGWGGPMGGSDPYGLDWLDDLSNWAAGFGDAVTFDVTKKIRQFFDYDDIVDYDSTAYAVGEVTGTELAKRPACAELPENEPSAGPTGRWTEARWLKIGDHFLTRTGKSATVSGLTIRIKRTKVYNLQIRTLQLYAVGNSGIIAHNSNIYNEYGKKIHKTWNYGPGFIRGRKFPSGRTPDAIDPVRKTVKELKPNNPRAIAKG